jgi:hypothetical protein
MLLYIVDITIDISLQLVLTFLLLLPTRAQGPLALTMTTIQRLALVQCHLRSASLAACLLQRVLKDPRFTLGVREV